jgi:hypothetical protein
MAQEVKNLLGKHEAFSIATKKDINYIIIPRNGPYHFDR